MKERGRPMPETFDAIVLGAGIVGVSAALALQARGRAVALIDRLPHAAGETSFGNSGIVQTEGVLPYLFPRAAGDIVRAAMNRDPRAHVRYGALPSIAPALLRYFLASTQPRKLATGKLMAPLMAAAAGEHLKLARDAGASGLLRPGGWIKAYRSERGRDLAHGEAEELKPFGIRPAFLDRAALTALEPHVGEKAIGGVHYREPLSTSDPGALVRSYAALLTQRGGRMERGEALSLEPSGAEWTVKTDSGPVTARDAVIALGPFLALLRQARLSHALRREGQRGAQPSGARSRAGLSRHPDGAGPEADDGGRIRAARRPAVAQASRAARTLRARAVPDRRQEGFRALDGPAPLPARHAPGHRAVPGQAGPLAQFRPPSPGAHPRADCGAASGRNDVRRGPVRRSRPVQGGAVRSVRGRRHAPPRAFFRTNSGDKIWWRRGESNLR